MSFRALFLLFGTFEESDPQVFCFLRKFWMWMFMNTVLMGFDRVSIFCVSIPIGNRLLNKVCKFTDLSFSLGENREKILNKLIFSGSIKVFWNRRFKRWKMKISGTEKKFQGWRGRYGFYLINCYSWTLLFWRKKWK